MALIKAGVGTCFHCGEPVVDRAAGSAYQIELAGELRSFCCLGCYGVASAICSEGLSKFYQYRETAAAKVDSAVESYIAYDNADIQQDFVEPVVGGRGLHKARLYVPSISCAACAWLIENYLMDCPGVESVSVNVASHRCSVVWDKSSKPLSEILQALSVVGYQSLPDTGDVVSDSRDRARRDLLMRLGLAGIGMMQVGMVSVALHAGDIQGMEDDWRYYLRWVSFFFALPIISFSAMPFFKSALRALRLKSVNMDVSVSIALLLAFAASFWATVTSSGQVYFDSLSMLVFFLLTGRYLELRARDAQASDRENLTQLLPITARKCGERGVELVPIKSLSTGDCIEVSAGAAFPCDGVVVEGLSSADESMLTGESLAVKKEYGDNVLAGSRNNTSVLIVRVLALGERTQLNAIHKIRNRALAEKPEYVTFANRMATWFVLSVLFVAAVNSVVWFFVAPDRAFWVTLSVLVITCPCALSLATPAALTAGVHRMRKLGLLVTSSQFIERLCGVTHVVFDKTGTLTSGQLSVREVKLHVDATTSGAGVVQTKGETEVLKIISALESKCSHPIASAFKGQVFDQPSTDVCEEPGLGVRGKVGNVEYRFGCSQFALPGAELNYPGEGSWHLLAADDQAIAWVLLEDPIKQDRQLLINRLISRGLKVSIVSGDRGVNVASFAQSLGGIDYVAEAKPADKLHYIHSLQKQGASVLMVGDGINDVPTLTGADASIAMGAASELVRSSAGSILLGRQLCAIDQAFELSGLVRVKIRQNLLWALIYNILALPLAVQGLVPPYIAAIGMSLSSLFVVANSLRLQTANLGLVEDSTK